MEIAVVIATLTAVTFMIVAGCIMADNVELKDSYSRLSTSYTSLQLSESMKCQELGKLRNQLRTLRTGVQTVLNDSEDN